MKYPAEEETSSAKGAAASPAAAFVLFLVCLALHSGLAVLRDATELGGIEFKLWSIGTHVVAILLPLYIAVRLFSLDSRKALFVAEPMWRRTIIAVPIAFAAALGFNLVWPRLIAPSSEYLSETGKFISYDGAAGFVLVIFTVVVVPPLADELLFRGIMLRAFSTRYGGVLAVLLTAAATSIFHTWEPFKLGHAFVMGIIFAVAVLWTRNVVTAILIHGLLNGLALLS